MSKLGISAIFAGVLARLPRFLSNAASGFIPFGGLGFYNLTSNTNTDV
ncbi:hypothetical protein [Hymenobacter sp. IS2118]|nr:hypothetical protein [Hymenobacter sp. IS2118]